MQTRSFICILVTSEYSYWSHIFILMNIKGYHISAEIKRYNKTSNYDLFNFEHTTNLKAIIRNYVHCDAFWAGF